jgi:hypothetical protein
MLRQVTRQSRPKGCLVLPGRGVTPPKKQCTQSPFLILAETSKFTAYLHAILNLYTPPISHTASFKYSAQKSRLSKVVPFRKQNSKGPHKRTVLLSVLTAQAKLCQICSVWPARGFTTHARLHLKNIDRFSL